MLSHPHRHSLANKGVVQPVIQWSLCSVRSAQRLLCTSFDRLDVCHARSDAHIHRWKSLPSRETPQQKGRALRCTRATVRNSDGMRRVLDANGVFRQSLYIPWRNGQEKRNAVEPKNLTPLLAAEALCPQPKLPAQLESRRRVCCRNIYWNQVKKMPERRRPRHDHVSEGRGGSAPKRGELRLSK